MKVDLWDAGELIAEYEIIENSKQEHPGLTLAACIAFARSLIESNEEANTLIGRAADAESHVHSDDDEILHAVTNHEQTVDAEYPVEVVS